MREDIEDHRLIELALLSPPGARVDGAVLETGSRAVKLELYLTASSRPDESLPPNLEHAGFAWTLLGGLPWTYAAGPKEWQHIGIYERGPRAC